MAETRVGSGRPSVLYVHKYFPILKFVFIVMYYESLQKQLFYSKIQYILYSNFIKLSSLSISVLNVFKTAYYKHTLEYKF